MLLRRSLALLALPVLAVGLLAGCGSSDTASNDAATTTKAASGSADTTPHVTFRLDEWSIRASFWSAGPSSTVPAGKTRIIARNVGNETHELVLVRMDDQKLPLKADGSVDEEMIPESRKVGEIPGVAGGDEVTKTFDLPAGRYVAFCNLVEQMGADSHMGSGMDSNMGSGMDSNMESGKDGGMTHVHYKLGMWMSFTVR